MSSTTKALALLDYFTTSEPEWGLSDLARAVGYNKATTLRMLSDLRQHGLVEQDGSSRKFRLGTAILTLARTREASFPLSTVIQPVLERLAADTGETGHAAIAVDQHMTTIAIADPARSTRVYVDPSQALPFHATASGVVYLAFAEEQVRNAILSADTYPRFATGTPKSPDALSRIVDEAGSNGYAISRNSLEEDVIGIAAPVFNQAGYAQGTVAVACLSSRMTSDHQADVATKVVRASIEVGETIGAKQPERYGNLVAGLLA